MDSTLPLSTASSHVSSARHGALVRLRARLAGGRLDRELARGKLPSDNELLAARAERLTSPSSRAALAAAIEDVLRRVSRPPAASSRAPIDRGAVQIAQGELEKLVSELRSDRDCDPRGVARCRQLLTDGAGPLYGRAGGHALETLVHWIRISLNQVAAR